jgi:DNA-binding transcriptional ArsR family regulator
MDVFAALGDPTRREVLRRVAGGPSRQAVSKHLSALVEAGLVERTVSGREVRYSLRAEPLSDVVGWVTEVGEAWDQRLANLKSRLDG